MVVTADANVIYQIISTTTPTASASGYGIGCWWVNKTGTVGSILFINVGTATSATWLAIT